MSAERLLGTLLRSLQTYTEQQDTPRLLSTTAHLLATLTNRRNVTLLTSHLLQSPAIWQRPNGLQTCMSFIGVFHSATHTKIRQEQERLRPEDDIRRGEPEPLRKELHVEPWMKAVLDGADERTPRWRHLMVIGGLLLGFKNAEDIYLQRSSESALERALVKASNLALADVSKGQDGGGACIALVLNHCFQYLPDFERQQINYDRLLPVLIGTLLFTPDGLEESYFLRAIDFDVAFTPDKKFSWSPKSSSYVQIQRVLERPLIASLGPLSRLISHTCENVKDAALLQTLMADLSAFSASIAKQWRRSKLSQVDLSNESAFLEGETLQITFPLLWRLLRSIVFAVVIILRGVIGRLIGDVHLANDNVAPGIAMQTLHILRDVYFISARLGANAFSQYNFVNLTAIDILTKYPNHAETFVQEIRPGQLGRIPEHPLDRNLDLYLLNTAEHFTLVLSPATNEELLIPAASPYLTPGGNRDLIQLFEAAHSAMLAVLIAPQSADLIAQHLPFYVDGLFKAFPQNLSPRQFCLAFRTLVSVVAPPAQLSATQPQLPSLLLELIHHRALSAPTVPLPQPSTPPATTTPNPLPSLSEQAALILAMIDALPYTPTKELEEWLPPTADLVNKVEDDAMRHSCRQRFWEVLHGGEMDAERSQVCVTWWNTFGGREQLLFGREEQQRQAAVMSGALPEAERSSKL